jgi:hypothetical protein
MFHELLVLMDLHVSLALPAARLVMGAVHGLVQRLEDTGAKADELPAAVAELVAQGGFTARLVGRTSNVMEFSVTRQ